MGQISDINFTTTHLKIIEGTSVVGYATGLFFRYQGLKYLATNRHVVIDEGEGFLPSALRLLLHADRSNLKANCIVDVRLNADGLPLWLEHPKYSEALCDVVLLPLTTKTILPEHFDLFLSSSIKFFSEENLSTRPTNPFGDVVVIGYPMGFFDEINNLPVYRKAMISTPYPFDFMDKPYFLIDANLHEGTSGSPVINSHHTLFKEEGQKEGYVLFGIHSAEHLVGEEPLGLNVVWHARLLVEIAEQV